ncbi:MAG: DUF1540 domain-containing protein [Clostridiales bacterium]|nr:DUF1540 domain-containing protein [Clostridiales bacterium]
MTNLKCSVTNCVYNDSHLCSKDAIRVGGEEATEQQYTCCESFCDCHHSSAKNNANCAIPQTKIGCEAVNCIYNENRYCHANHIDITGNGAGKPEQTECSTFKMK